MQVKIPGSAKTSAEGVMNRTLGALAVEGWIDPDAGQILDIIAEKFDVALKGLRRKAHVVTGPVGGWPPVPYTSLMPIPTRCSIRASIMVISAGSMP